MGRDKVEYTKRKDKKKELSDREVFIRAIIYLTLLFIIFLVMEIDIFINVMVILTMFILVIVSIKDGKKRG